MNRYLLVLFLLAFAKALTAQTVIGVWKTIDDETQEPKSYVEIYEEDGEIKGRVHKILADYPQDSVCINCEDERKNKPVLGMVILEGMSYDEDGEYDGGIILDPENGKEYRCKIWLDEDNPDILHVRGYVAFFYRTQQWIRVR